MEKLKLEAEGKKEITKKFNQTEKEAKKMKNNLEIKDEEISSLSLSLETQQVSHSSKQLFLTSFLSVLPTISHT